MQQPSTISDTRWRARIPAAARRNSVSALAALAGGDSSSGATLGTVKVTRRKTWALTKRLSTAPCTVTATAERLSASRAVERAPESRSGGPDGHRGSRRINADHNQQRRKRHHLQGQEEAAVETAPLIRNPVAGTTASCSGSRAVTSPIPVTGTGIRPPPQLPVSSPGHGFPSEASAASPVAVVPSDRTRGSPVPFGHFIRPMPFATVHL